MDRELLLKLGFEEKEHVKWFGNDADYQVGPEDGGSSTEYFDFVKHIKGTDYGFIVRKEIWTYNEFKDADINWSFAVDEWHPKCCIDSIPCHEVNYSNLLIAYKLAIGEDLENDK